MPNYVLLVLPSASLAVFFAWPVTRRETPLSVVMLLGLTLEVLGYAGRITARRNWWDDDLFIPQIRSLTVAPVFYVRGLYLCLTTVVVVIWGANLSFDPKQCASVAQFSWPSDHTYFIPCDAISLSPQFAGGGVVSVAPQDNAPRSRSTTPCLPGCPLKC